MPEPFRIVSLPGFERDVGRRLRGNPQLIDVLEEVRAILVDDPYNRSRKYAIKKLAGVKPGEGQWRLRSGDFRLRYDIFDQDVVLYSFRHRRDAYRR